MNSLHAAYECHPHCILTQGISFFATAVCLASASVEDILAASLLNAGHLVQVPLCCVTLTERFQEHNIPVQVVKKTCQASADACYPCCYVTPDLGFFAQQFA